MEIDPDPKKCSHRNSGQNGPVEKFTALMATIFATIHEKASLSQKRSHQNSGQNGPVEKFTALTATIFVTISVFMSRGHFRATFGSRFPNFDNYSGTGSLILQLSGAGSLILTICREPVP